MRRDTAPAIIRIPITAEAECDLQQGFAFAFMAVLVLPHNAPVHRAAT
ncbi:hypothetical protein [Thermostilla marina]